MAAAPDHHLFSVSLYRSALCDTFSHVFIVKPFSRSKILRKAQSFHKIQPLWNCSNPSCDCWHPPVGLNSSRGPKHGASERQIMFFKMLKKARQPKHGGLPTILARWYAEERYRDSLAEHNIGETEIMLYDRIALERHDYTVARAERLQNAKRWVLRLNADGPQMPLRQRP